MNIYDKKIIKCLNCKKSIGEIDYDASVVFPQCGNCGEPIPAVEDYIAVYNNKNNFVSDVISN